MKTKLIITAHDFGLCKAVNDGIIYSLNHPNSIITELALLPNAPGSEEAAAIAKTLDVSVSLNLNFTTFRPLAAHVPSMVDRGGNFLKVDITTWDFRSFDRFTDEDVRKEIDAQCNWFVDHVGKPPTAILSRKNEHGDPKVLLPLVTYAKKHKLALRTPVWQWKQNYGAQSYVQQENVPTTDAIFIGLLDWKGKYGYDLDRDIDRLVQNISATKGIAELVVFIGFVDEEVFALSTVNWQRAQFLSILDNDEVIRKIRNAFSLITYRELKK